MMAKKSLSSFNDKLPKALLGMHDIYLPLDPPHRREIQSMQQMTASVRPYSKVDPAKVVGIVHTSSYDCVKPFTAPDEVSKQIGSNVVPLPRRRVHRRSPSQGIPSASNLAWAMWLTPCSMTWAKARSCLRLLCTPRLSRTLYSSFCRRVNVHLQVLAR